MTAANSSGDHGEEGKKQWVFAWACCQSEAARFRRTQHVPKCRRKLPNRKVRSGLGNPRHLPPSPAALLLVLQGVTFRETEDNSPTIHSHLNRNNVRFGGVLVQMSSAGNLPAMDGNGYPSVQVGGPGSKRTGQHMFVPSVKDGDGAEP
jgi:hypothetical protein